MTPNAVRWNPQTYLAFADERSRPFVDLVARVEGVPGTIVDLGCGPGHLTEVLRGRWPDADVLGVDSSVEMIERAVAGNTDSRARYLIADVSEWAPDEPVDLVISNATLQWLPDPLATVARLREHVAPGGALAFQVPNNFAEPSHVLLHEISSRDPYARFTEVLHLPRGVDPTTFLDLLSRPGWALDVWETTYLHVLHGDDPVFDWISGTGARPVMQALPENLRTAFVAEFKAALRAAYPARSYGTVLPFQRVFVVARRVDSSNRGLA